MLQSLSIWIDGTPIVWDFSGYVSDINRRRAEIGMLVVLLIDLISVTYYHLEYFLVSYIEFMPT